MSTSSAPMAFSEKGRRDTRQRRALREHLAGMESFVSALQIYDDLRAGGDKIALSTTYRTLQAMAEAGEIDSVRADDGEMLYRKCGPRHHHHLVCRNCGTTAELHLPNAEQWVTQAAEEHGFTEVKHTIELFGLCADCSDQA